MITPRWIEEELCRARLRDARRRRRLKHILASFDARPSATVPEALGTWAATKATYRFWSCSKIDEQDILSGLYGSTAARAATQELVLAVNDTTEFDFTQRRTTTGLGYLDSPLCRGLKMHSVLAVSTDGVPLGLLDEQCWIRDPALLGQTKPARRAITEKESYRWLKALRAAEQRLAPGQRLLMVADQEADLFELLAMPRQSTTELLVRAHYDRKLVGHSERLRQAVEAAPVLGTKAIAIRRGDERAARTATVSVRVASVEVAPPAEQQHRLLPVPLSVLLLREQNPPQAAEPIEQNHVCVWLLVTTLAISTAEEAFTCVCYYSYRWLIERFHYVLKSGCRIEDLQLERAEALRCAIATYSYIAWRQLSLTYQSRVTPDASCEPLLSRDEWQALSCLQQKTPTPPTTPPTLQQAILWIAMLGGFLARKGDGQPGVKTIWRGLRRLSDITEAWKLFRPPIPDDTPSG